MYPPLQRFPSSSRSSRMYLKVLVGVELASSLALLSNILRQLLQRRRVRARQGISLITILEDEEGGDAANAQLKGQVGHLVGVEAGKGVFVVGEGLGVLVEHGGDGFAGAAPGCVGLEGDVGRFLGEFVELGFGLDVDDGHFD